MRNLQFVLASALFPLQGLLAQHHTEIELEHERFTNPYSPPRPRRYRPKKKLGPRIAYPRTANDDAVRDGLTIAGYDAAVRDWMANGRQGPRPQRDGEKRP